MVAYRHALSSIAVMLAIASGPVASAAPDAFNERLRKLSPVQQKAAMRQAITNNAQPCGRVDRAGFQQPFGNLMMWTAHCVPGGDYAIFVGRDQSVQVRVCNQMAALKLPRCRA